MPRRIDFFFNLNAAGSSRNTPGSNEKQREATGNDLQSISSDLQRSTGQRKTRKWFCNGRGRARDATRRHGGAFPELRRPSLGSNIVPRAHAASLARTHERNEYDFPVGLTPPTSDHTASGGFSRQRWGEVSFRLPPPPGALVSNTIGGWGC